MSRSIAPRRPLPARILRVALTAIVLACAGMTGDAPAQGDSVSERQAQLVMVEQRGCVYCLRWMEEVAPEYPLTPEGRAAPLVQVNIRDGAPDGMTFSTRVVYTPTFILVVDGQEVDRLEGYMGEDFFWGLLGRMLREAEIPFGEGGS